MWFRLHPRVAELRHLPPQPLQGLLQALHQELQEHPQDRQTLCIGAQVTLHYRGLQCLVVAAGVVTDSEVELRLGLNHQVISNLLLNSACV